jgi:hypothetical protein
MAHEHHHDPSSYYTEQLCTVAFCGAFGGIAVAVYASGVVNNILKQGILQYSLLAGGIVLLITTKRIAASTPTSMNTPSRPPRTDCRL